MIMAIVVVYLLVTLVVGAALSARIKRASDYLVAGRNLGLALTTASLAAVQIGAGVVLGGAEVGASSGVWPAARELLGKRYSENTEADQLCLKGRHFWAKRTGRAVEKAIGYFQQAIEKEPRCAKAAEAEFHEALARGPNYATAHHWYGMYLVARGQFDQAIAEVERAQQLDPVSLAINTDLGLVLYRARKYDEAIKQYRAAVDLDPSFSDAQWLEKACEERDGGLTLLKVDPGMDSLRAEPRFATILERVGLSVRL